MATLCHADSTPIDHSQGRHWWFNNRQLALATAADFGFKQGLSRQDVMHTPLMGTKCQVAIVKMTGLIASCEVCAYRNDTLQSNFFSAGASSQAE